MKRFYFRSINIFMLFFALVTGASSNAAEIHVFSTTAMRAAFEKITTDFENSTGHHLVFTWGASSGTAPDALPMRIKNGEAFDLALMIAESIEEQISLGSIHARSKFLIASSRIGLAVRPGMALPDISTIESLKNTMRMAKSVAFSSGVSGIYVAGTLFPKLGMAEELALKSVLVEAPKLVGDALLRGEADVGLQQMSELLAVPGIQIAGPLPDSAQRVNFIAAGVGKNARQPQAARLLIEFLKKPEVIQKLKESGFDPVKTLPNADDIPISTGLTESTLLQ